MRTSSPSHRTLFSWIPLTLAVASLALAGCGGDETGPTGDTVEQLEAIEVAGEAAYEAVEYQGQVKITGQERDFQLEIGSTKLTVHSPGMSRLNAIDGRDVTARLEPKGLHEERSASISDADGLLYVANVGHGFDADAVFGEGFATWGKTIGENSDDLYEWDYTEAKFKTDKGDVSVKPGNTAILELDGALWRVAVIAAYRVTPHPDAALPCGGISDLLSYEMLRIQEKEEPAQIARPSTAKLAHLGCMAD
jgi:hypothetical protein